MKIVFAGGGTGGHFYPIIAVAQKINKIMAEEKIIGAKLYYFSDDPYDKEALFENDIIFDTLPNEIEVGRYHSWVLSNDNFPPHLIITSVDANKNIMSVKHSIYDVRGVQFHPESILTPDGKQLLENWLNN